MHDAERLGCRDGAEAGVDVGEPAEPLLSSGFVLEIIAASMPMPAITRETWDSVCPPGRVMSATMTSTARS
jgi:hypothetical protein